jgi:type IV secretion system protein VirD4
MQHLNKIKQTLAEVRQHFWQDLKVLFRAEPDPERPVKLLLYALGLVFFAFPAGALVGYRYAYKKLFPNQDRFPELVGMPRLVYAAMVGGVFLVFLYPLAGLLIFAIGTFFAATVSPYLGIFIFGAITYLLVNFFFTSGVMLAFEAWRAGIHNAIGERTRYGSAEYMPADQLVADYGQPHLAKNGFYVGQGAYYGDAGHLLTVAGTRAGKGVNIIVPNLLKTGPFNKKGCWVVIDPKGENAAITAQAQRDMGRKVVMLNPWDLLNLGNSPYNPLDILKMDKYNLVDDVEMIAESIVPKGPNTDDHFNNRARSVISGLLLHLVTKPSPTAPLVDDSDKHLGTLWEWLRLDMKEWLDLINSMVKNTHPYAGDVVQASAYEILALMENGEREWSSIRSTAQKWTDFLKSPALRESLAVSQDFNSADLAQDLVTVYIIIPADRLKTQSQWLRLLVTSLMRSVIRNPKNEVCFLLDEYYALGYLSEIDIALGSYAGYGVHVWAILQNLVQLQDQHGASWENFISSCSVKHFFNVSDNTSANYISAMFGQSSFTVLGLLGNPSGYTQRSLLNPDELRRSSAETIYTVIDQNAPAQLRKLRYFENPELIAGKDYAPNPYHKA